MSTRKPVVMTVDDSQSVRQLVRALLEEAGYSVLEAEDGQAALDRLRGTWVDAVLVDVNMPHMNGFELVERMRRMRRLRSVPVVFLSVETGPRVLARARRAGALDFIVKPFDDGDLLARVEAALRPEEALP